MSLGIAQNYIYQALRQIGNLRPGYIPGPELLADALTEWGLLFDEANTDGLNEYSNPEYTYTIAGPGSRNGGNGYTIGPVGADLTGPRPTSIVRANTILNSTSPSPVYIPMRPISEEQWAALAIRQMPSINVTALFWYDPQNPNGVMNFFPPLSAGSKIELFQWGVLVVPATLNTAFAGPPGYDAWVVAGLAERMYHMVPDQVIPNKRPYEIVATRAGLALDKLKMLNRQINPLGNDYKSGDPNAAGFYDSFVYLTGEPY